MHSIWPEFTGFLARNWQELVGSLTGALCVWLLVKQNIWNWPIGITNNIFYIIIFYKSGLFADAGLQFVYIAIAIYGWWNWLHGGLQHGELEVKTASPSGVVGYLAMAGAATAILYWVLSSLYAQHGAFCRRTDRRAVSDSAIHDVKKDRAELVVLDCGRRAGHRALIYKRSPISVGVVWRSFWRCALRVCWNGRRHRDGLRWQR